MLRERFESKYRVYITPELATITINAGVTIHPDKFTERSHANFTKALIKMQMDMESYFINLAMQEEGDSIIFTDRGYLDNFAYCTEKVRDIILAETGWTLDLLSNHAYDAVFHLVTAADGAEHAYTTANNAARTETAETARW